MQEKYIGDERDYVKYALLRHPAKTLGPRLGVNWFRTDDIDCEKKDGEVRDYLSKPEWRGLDGELFDALKEADFEKMTNRKIPRLEQLNIWPKDKILFRDPIPVASDMREVWFQKAKAKLASADWLFLDPNMGREKKTMEQEERQNYILNQELCDYVLDTKKVVVLFQMQGRMEPEERRAEMEALGIRSNLPIIARRSVLHFTFAPPERERELSGCLQEFADMHKEKIRLIV